MTYDDFLAAKVNFDHATGFPCDASEVHPLLKPHQRAAVAWAVRGGRRALFEAFGLGKSLQQLEILRLVLEKAGGGRGLIVAPLGVRQEFRRDAEKIGQTITFLRRSEEIGGDGLYITNYESIRDGKLDPRLFTAVSLDEASVLRGFGGSKTFREFMREVAGDGGRGPTGTGRTGDGVRFRFVATATPSPNEYIELLAYAAFLDILDVSQGKTRWFKRNSEKADQLTLHPHKEQEWWMWVASWALFVERPSDLGFDDTGYELPPIEVVWHELPVDHSEAGQEKDGQGRMFRNASMGLSEAAKEKRDTLAARIAKMVDLVNEDPEAHFVLWHDLEAERNAITAALPEAVEVYGSQDLDERERRVIDFSDGKIRLLATKPSVSGSGCNFQRFCHRAIFLGIGWKFNDFIQALHRIQRFLQPEPVRIDLIYAASEREIRQGLEAKWRNHTAMVGKMTEIIRGYGLNEAAMAHALRRSIGVERREVSGEGWRAINNDCVSEVSRMASDSIDLGITSIPFANQYEYTPSYNDFGHTDDNAHFWRQMDFLTPELLRVTKPGRIFAVHVKDRITPGGINGFGFQTVEPVSDECITHFRKHGWAFLGRKTIVTDVVRENNQTYRLGWTEQCKDGSRMGAGMPEYVLLFRKPPTDRSNGYADVPVVKSKAKYSRARWQFDAHGFSRSGGNRLLSAEDLIGQPADLIFKLFRAHSESTVYNFDHDVAIGEALEAARQLPPTFMLLQPQSWHPDVWTDVTRMRTLNGMQHAKGKELHLCPLQFDIVDRLIAQFSMEGETVLDPFGGLMTVPYCALKAKRRGIGIELSAAYWLDGCAYLRAAEQQMATPTLFDLIEAERGDAA